MDDRNICGGGVCRANGVVITGSNPASQVTKERRFVAVMTTKEAMDWHEKYSDLGYDDVSVTPLEQYMVCRAVKYA